MLRTIFATDAFASPIADPIRRCSRVGVVAVAVFMRTAALLAAGAAITGAASAQDASGILAPGNAVVTGFSGTQGPGTAPQGVDPADLTEIDLSGPSARIVDLQAPGAPPQAQLLTAPKRFTVTASQVGQVFAVALDDATPPNIYLGATSAYGLPIIAPGPGGGPVRVKQGAPNASFMPGLFGPAQAGGGPGSIWRVDGVSGEVRLFANVALEGVANSGAALGGLAFDPASHTLFAADRGTGMIHAFDLNGTERGRFDHGTLGRAAAGLAPVAYDPAGRLDIASPAFHTDDPSTWGYAAPERRVYGLAVRAGRLYYAVADGQVWSVAIGPDGGFAGDARVELQVPPWDGGSEISKIAFDDQGTILLAERAASTGAYDFGALAREGVGRVLRFAPMAPAQADQSMPPQGDQQSMPAAAQIPAASGGPWQPAPDEYAIGFPGQMRNGNGGVAIGYRYGPNGMLDRSTCGGFVWSTGEQLRVTADQALAAQLAAGGPAIVNGLQGNAIELVRPANVPPLQTYFVDYDDKFSDADARGHLGDIAIWRICGGGAAYVVPVPPPALLIPVRPCQPGDFRQPDGQCCERRWVHEGRCAPPCERGEIYLRDGRCCDPRWVRNGRCEPPPCPRGQVRQPNGQCCDPRTVRNGQCSPPPSTCPPGQILLPNGQCCDPLTARSGQCSPPPSTCPPGQILLPNGQCCDPRTVSNGQCSPPPSTCPPGEVMVANGTCCLPTFVQNGVCVPAVRRHGVPPTWTGPHRHDNGPPPRRLREIKPNWHPQSHGRIYVPHNTGTRTPKGGHSGMTFR
jgi:hypothetical protein